MWLTFSFLVISVSCSVSRTCWLRIETRPLPWFPSRPKGTCKYYLSPALPMTWESQEGVRNSRRAPSSQPLAPVPFYSSQIFPGTPVLCFFIVQSYLDTSRFFFSSVIMCVCVCVCVRLSVSVCLCLRRLCQIILNVGVLFLLFFCMAEPQNRSAAQTAFHLTGVFLFRRQM